MAYLSLGTLKKVKSLQQFIKPNLVRTNVKLGRGSFGTVEVLEGGGAEYAGKTLHDILLDFDEQELARRFVSECSLMSEMLHPNIVQFMGVCFFDDSPNPILVMEKLAYSLDDFLEKKSAAGQELDLSLKLHILLNVTKGLHYLHDRENPIIHRDLTARNVLLDNSMNAKISDLGNALIIDPQKLTKTLTTLPGAYVYMPPEAFSHQPTYGVQLDMFSFGHLSLYTIIQIFPENLLEPTYHHPETNVLTARSEVERRREYIDILHNKYDDTFYCIEQCLNNREEERPTSQAVMAAIAEIRVNLEDPYMIFGEANKADLVELVDVMKQRETKVAKEAASEQKHMVEECLRGSALSVLLQARAEEIQNGSLGVLEIYTTKHKAGLPLVIKQQMVWKPRMFKITVSGNLQCLKNGNEIRGQLCLAGITGVRALRVEPDDDPTKYYFEISFTGKGSPWKLRTHSDNDRTAWMEAIKPGTVYPVSNRSSGLEENLDELVDCMYMQIALDDERKKAKQAKLAQVHPEEVCWELHANNDKDDLYETFPEEYDDEPLYDEVPCWDDTPTPTPPPPLPRQSSASHKEDLFESLELEDESTNKKPDPDGQQYHGHTAISKREVTKPVDTSPEHLDATIPPGRGISDSTPISPDKDQRVTSVNVNCEPRGLDDCGYASIHFSPVEKSPEKLHSEPLQSDSQENGAECIYEEPKFEGGGIGFPPSSFSQLPYQANPGQPVDPNQVQLMILIQMQQMLQQTMENTYGSFAPQLQYGVVPPQFQYGPLLPGMNYRAVRPQMQPNTAMQYLTFRPQQQYGAFMPQMQYLPEGQYSTHNQHVQHGAPIQGSQMHYGAQLQMSETNRTERADSCSSQSPEALPTLHSSPAPEYSPQEQACTSDMPVPAPRRHNSKSQSDVSEATTQIPPVPKPRKFKASTTAASECRDKPTNSTEIETSQDLCVDQTLQKESIKSKETMDSIQLQSNSQMKDVLGNLLDDNKTISVDAMLLTEESDLNDSDDTNRPEWAKASTSEPNSLQLATLEDLQKDALFIPESALEGLEDVGQGKFGQVYKAQLHREYGTVTVAVKTIKKYRSEKDTKDFYQEMNMMLQMIHPNIVQIYGLVQQDPPLMVMEYLQYGDLKSFLITQQRPIERLVKYMLDIAVGMHYISERGLVHRDLAARNIVVGENEICKVSDFGLLREIPKDEALYTSQTRGGLFPIRWMAPESLKTKQFSPASDVWSYGVLLWEMRYPKKTPYADSGVTRSQIHTKVVDGSLRLEIPLDYPPTVQKIMKACWHDKPHERPSFLLISSLLTSQTFGRQVQSSSLHT